MKEGKVLSQVGALLYKKQRLLHDARVASSQQNARIVKNDNHNDCKRVTQIKARSEKCYSFYTTVLLETSVEFQKSKIRTINVREKKKY